MQRVKNNGQFQLFYNLYYLSLPILIENILQVSLGFIDTYFISTLGKEALASTGVTSLIVNIYISFFTALGVGTSALVSRYFGSKNEEKTILVIEQSIFLSIVLGLILAIVNLIFYKPILKLLGINNSLIYNASIYFLVINVPIVFLCLMTIISSILRSVGDTKTPMIVNFLCNVINIILNYIFVFKMPLFKNYPIFMIGLSTSISRIIGSIILLIKLNKKFSLTNFRNFKVNLNTIKSINSIGLPAGLEKLFMRFGQLVYGKMIIGIGISAYAAHNIAGQIESFSYLPAMAFGTASATLIGQSLGIGEKETAEKYGYISFITSSLIMVIIGIFFFVYSKELVMILTDDKKVIQYSSDVLRLIALFQPFLASTQVISSSLQGAGDTKFPMYLTIVGIWGIRVLGLYIVSLYMDLNLYIVWISYVVEIIFRGSLLFIRFYKGNWKNISIGEC